MLNATPRYATIRGVEDLMQNRLNLVWREKSINRTLVKTFVMLNAAPYMYHPMSLKDFGDF